MKSRSIVLILSALFLMSIVSIPVYATVQNFTWSWTQCTGGQAKGAFQIDATVNSALVTITWNVPSKSYEQGFVCEKTLLQIVAISAYVTTISFKPIPVQHASAATTGFVQLTLMAESCYRNGCTQPKPYPVPYGSNVVVSIYALYQVGVDQYSHGTTDSMKVTT